MFVEWIGPAPVASTTQNTTSIAALNGGEATDAPGSGHNTTI